MLDFSTFYVLRTTYFIDAAFHIKPLFVFIVMLAVQNLAEAAHRLCKRHILAVLPREYCRYGEGLRKEALNFPRAIYELFILF